MKFICTRNAKLPGKLGKQLQKSLRLTSAAILAFSTAFGPLAAVPASAQSQSRNYVKVTEENASLAKEIRLGLDKSIVIDLPADAHDILVANPEVADAVTRTSRRIYIFGKKIGQTNIFVFDGRGQQVAALELIIERDIAGLEETIRRLIPQSDVKAEMINDNIVLTGTVTTPQAAAMAIRLAEIFVKGGENTADSNENSGQQATLLLGGSEDKPESQVVNMLKIDGEDQVHLKVVIAEIQRSVVKQLGLNTSISNGPGGFNFQTIGGQSSSTSIFNSPTADPDTGDLLSGIGGAASFADPLGRLSTIYHALERNGVMRTLAEPSLTAISGEQAQFKVGGDYNVPSDINSTGIRFRVIEYGVALAFTPVVLTSGRISLKIHTEVSEPTVQDVHNVGANVNLYNVRKRMADTTVELPSGGSMVIAGLVQDDIRQAVTGQPGLMDIPFFGSLFRSREFVRNESEVVIIVTPYLVRATSRKNLVQPDKNFQPASDAAGYFMGRVNRVYGTKQGDLPKGRYTGSIGFILK